MTENQINKEKLQKQGTYVGDDLYLPIGVKIGESTKILSKIKESFYCSDVKYVETRGSIVDKKSIPKIYYDNTGSEQMFNNEILGANHRNKFQKKSKRRFDNPDEGGRF